MADTPIPEMVERVAKRIGDTIQDNPYTFRDLLIHALIAFNGPTTAQQREWYEHGVDRWLIAMSREAIAAMRKPTEAMEKAFHVAAPMYDDPMTSGEEYWDAGISAALGK